MELLTKIEGEFVPTHDPNLGEAKVFLLQGKITSIEDLAKTLRPVRAMTRSKVLIDITGVKQNMPPEVFLKTFELAIQDIAPNQVDLIALSRRGRKGALIRVIHASKASEGFLTGEWVDSDFKYPSPQKMETVKKAGAYTWTGVKAAASGTKEGLKKAGSYFSEKKKSLKIPKKSKWEAANE